MPRATASASSVLPVPSPSIAPVPHRILVAEDDLEMRCLIEEALRCDGHDVVAVGSGLKLFDTLRLCVRQGRMPDLVISDVRMPGMTGLQALARLRAEGWKMPVVLITAFGDDELFDEAAALGGSCVFSKPFDLDDLRTAALCLLPTAIKPELRLPGWPSGLPRG